jgi:hypothetical protein
MIIKLINHEMDKSDDRTMTYLRDDTGILDSLFLQIPFILYTILGIYRYYKFSSIGTFNVKF